MMSVQEAPSSVHYHNEIKCMMYSFGDGKSPVAESISLIEDLTRAQVAEIVVKAAEVAHLRSGTCVIVEDVLFLLRKNLDKLKLVLQHIQHLEKSKAARSSELPEEGPGLDLVQPVHDKKTKYSLDFLSPRDQANVDSEEKSATMLQRLETMDRMTVDMDSSEYMHYSSCRQVNFHKNSSKFTAWLDLDSLTDLRMKQDAIEVVALLAHEIIREMTELALQVKEDMEDVRLRPPHVSNPRHHHPLPPLSSSPLHRELSPTPSPSMTSQDAERQRLGSTGSRTATTPLEERGSGPQRRKRKTKALQPHHIREAFRRYSYSHGPVIPLSTHFRGSSVYQHNLCT